MILVITKKNDSHLSYVVPFLNDYIVLNTDDIPEKVSGTLSNLNSKLTICGRVIKSDDVKSIWFRKPNPIASRSQDINVGRFIEREWSFFLRNLYQVLGNAKWMNHPEKNRACNQKIEQLQRAKSFKLAVPDTLMTNSKNDAVEFVSSHGCCILKVVDQVITTIDGIDRAMYAKKITLDDVKKAEGLNITPIILQPYIEKEFELRVTYVYGKLFACRIDSQTDERSKLDWRAGNIKNVPHSTYDLPIDIAQKIIKLVESYDLKFAAIDLIVTPKGEYVFLEINPNGQWAWIELMTKMPIGQSIAEFLNGS